VLSDHTQVFTSSQLSKKVNVRSFHESSAEQPVINPDEWWCRCVLTIYTQYMILTRVNRYFWVTKQAQITTQRRFEVSRLYCYCCLLSQNHVVVLASTTHMRNGRNLREKTLCTSSRIPTLLCAGFVSNLVPPRVPHRSRPRTQGRLQRPACAYAPRYPGF
jgi:hypothetical protein